MFCFVFVVVAASEQLAVILVNITSLHQNSVDLRTESVWRPNSSCIFCVFLLGVVSHVPFNVASDTFKRQLLTLCLLVSIHPILTCIRCRSATVYGHCDHCRYDYFLQ